VLTLLETACHLSQILLLKLTQLTERSLTLLSLIKIYRILTALIEENLGEEKQAITPSSEQHCFASYLFS
jgi:hypothetical protein